MKAIKCAILGMVLMVWAWPAMAAPPQKVSTPKATKAKASQKANLTRVSPPVYSVAKLKAGCAKLGKAARWNAQTSRCELVSKSANLLPLWVALGVVGGMAVGATVAAVVISSSASPTSVKVGGTSDGAGLW